MDGVESELLKSFIKMQEMENDLKDFNVDNWVDEEEMDMEQEEGEGKQLQRLVKKQIVYRLKALIQELIVEELLVHGSMETKSEF